MKRKLRTRKAKSRIIQSLIVEVFHRFIVKCHHTTFLHHSISTKFEWLGNKAFLAWRRVYFGKGDVVLFHKVLNNHHFCPQLNFLMPHGPNLMLHILHNQICLLVPFNYPLYFYESDFFLRISHVQVKVLWKFYGPASFHGAIKSWIFSCLREYATVLCVEHLHILLHSASFRVKKCLACLQVKNGVKHSFMRYIVFVVVLGLVEVSGAV